MPAGQRVLIVGGGIGGLAAALALRQAGLDADVFERDAQLRGGGAVTLHPRARNALARIGMTAALETLGGIRNHTFALKTPRGRTLVSRPGDGVTFARQELVDVLAAGLPDDALHLNARLVGFDAGGADVTVRFEGREERAAVLVGADGIHSVVRRHTIGEMPLRYAGFAAWRSIAAFEHPGLPAGVAQFAVGRGQRFGMLPMSEGRVDWFAWRVAPEGESNAGRRKETLLAQFRDWYSPIAELIAATPEADIMVGRVHDRPPSDRWGGGRVTLLGDAAHPALPSSGQGAGLAVEDALVLAEELARVDLGDGAAVSTALRTYETRRMAPTSAVVRQAWRNSRSTTWRNPLLCWARDARFLASRVTARLG